MHTIVHTADLENNLDALTITDLGENIYRISEKNKNPLVLEVLAVDLALKTIKIRQNHSVYDLDFKNNLDLVFDKMGIKRAVDTISTAIKAPMPGKVIDILVKEGQEIAKGDGILILEAMKMENVLKAEHDCIIKKTLVSQGNSVEKNEILIELA